MNVIFKYKTETNQSVQLAADFTHWSLIPMCDMNERGQYVFTTDLPPGKYEYKFVVNGQYILDPSNPQKTICPFGYNSVFHVKRSRRAKDCVVAVIAPMSAGKSTLLNAIISQEILSTCNEACTASVTRIENNSDLHETMGYFETDSGEKSAYIPLSYDNLSGWNEKGYRISIYCNIPFVKKINPCRNLVFLDTPGPNNSRDKNHEAITKHLIQSDQYSMVIFVFDARNLGTDSEHDLLLELYNELNKKRRKKILFVMNQADLLDIGKKEIPKNYLDEVKKDLLKIGFKNPRTIPTMAFLSLKIRQAERTAKAISEDELSNLLVNTQGYDKSLPAYICTLPEDYQVFLATKLKIVLKNKKYFVECFSKNQIVKNKNMRRKNVSKDRSEKIQILIDGQFFNSSILQEVDSLTGIPLLEKFIGVELQRGKQRLVTKTKRHRRKNN